MKKSFKLLLTILLVTVLSMGLFDTINAYAATEVVIPDVNLRTAIKSTLALGSETPITTDDMLNLRYLSISPKDATETVHSLEGLEYATNLVGLTIYQNNNNKDVLEHLESISGLAKLTSLQLTRANISDLSFLSQNTNLTYLCLNDNKITDITPLANLVKLRTLQLNGSLGSSIGSVRGENSSTNSVSDLSPLAGLTTLTSLELDQHGDAIQDISALSGLTNMTSLKLEQNNIKDITAITHMVNLTSLEIGDNAIENVPDLSMLNKLTWLRMSDSPNMTNADIEKIGAIKSLTMLEVGNAFGWNDSKLIDDITPLGNLTQLYELTVNGTSISDIAVLSNMHQLATIKMRDNLIEDISPLASITTIKYLDMQNNRISDVSPLAGNTFTQMCSLKGNEITDISMLDISTGNFYVTQQVVSLPDVYLGTTTDIKIADNTGATPNLTWNTNGSYVSEQLLWDSLGNNQIAYASANGKLTGVIKQKVVPAPIPSPATLEVGNDMTIFEGNSYNVITDVKATDYDNVDLANKITYTITSSTQEIVSNDLTTLRAGTYTVMYSVVGKTNDVVTKHKQLIVLPVPTIRDIYEDETSLTGTAQVNTSLEIISPRGDIKTITADKNGNWTIPTDGTILSGEVFSVVATNVNAGKSKPTETIVQPVNYVIDASDVTMSVGELQSLRQNGILETYVLEQSGAIASKTARTKKTMAVQADVAPLENLNKAGDVSITTYTATAINAKTPTEINTVVTENIGGTSVVTNNDDTNATSVSSTNMLPMTGQMNELFIMSGLISLFGGLVIINRKNKK